MVPQYNMGGPTVTSHFVALIFNTEEIYLYSHREGERGR